jgi:Na+-driven multidrug efflux pump
MPIVAIGITGMAILRAFGDARRSMFATLAGGVVNAVLDPLFIFGFGLGWDGAAIATVISRFAMLAAALYPVLKVHQGFARPTLFGLKSDLTAVSAIAAPAVLTNIATPVGSAIVTREIAQFGTDAVAGMAVIGRLMPLAFAVILALSGAIGPIVGQNFGARKFDRVKGAYNAGLIFAGVYVALTSAMLFVLRAPIANVFEAQGMTLTLIYLFCGPLALASFFNAVIFVGNASFNNLGHPMYSSWINWGRNTIGMWPFVIVGAQYWGASGVLIGQAAGGVVFALISWLLVRRVSEGLLHPVEADPFVEQSRLHALSGRNR